MRIAGTSVVVPDRGRTLVLSPRVPGFVEEAEVPPGEHRRLTAVLDDAVGNLLPIPVDEPLDAHLFTSER